MRGITDYPLIAITEVFAIPSVDNVVCSDYYGGETELGPTGDILDSKLSDVTGDYAWRDKSEALDPNAGYGWGRETKIDKPIHIITWDGPTTDTYGHEHHPLRGIKHGDKIMGNGHHRLAYQAFVQGALFVHYTDSKHESGW